MKTDSTPNEGPVQAEQGSILEFITFLLRHRKKIMISAGAAFVIVFLILSFGDKKYTSSASFMPEASSQTSALAAVAAQFGASGIGVDPTQSPAFYTDLLKSREVLSAVLEADYHFPTDTGAASGKLIDFLKVSASTNGLRMMKSITTLSGLLNVDLRVRTGVIGLQVRMPNAVLAQEVAQRLLDELNRFNLERRQSRAGAERRFTDSRMVQLQAEQRNAEDDLQSFLQQNRDYKNSPVLALRYDRMVREVDFRKSVYVTVAQANEKARIDEARDTPVITVIEPPSLPAREDGRGRTVSGLLAVMFGGLIGIGIGFVGDSMERRRKAIDPEFMAFSAAADETRRDLRRMLTRLGGRKTK